MDADGSNVTQLTDEVGFDSWGSYSPDGQHITFISDRSGNFDLWIIAADGSAPTQLTDDDFFDLFPGW